MNQALTPVKQFASQLQGDTFQGSLAQYLDKDTEQQARFTKVVIRAVQEEPDLLNADRKSLFLACERAAQDGLLPDKKDGALVVYNTKVNDRWIKKVQWQPMIGGLRKIIARNGFSLRAEIVYEKDEFHYELGDNPRVEHCADPFGNRGKIVGAYAIAIDRRTGEIWRDAMPVEELEKVRMSSKSPEGGPWTTWRTEMYRKTVAKRLFKQLPILNEDIADVIERDNEQFNMDVPATSDTAREVQKAARAQVIDVVPEEQPKPKKKKVTKKKTAAKKKPEPEEPPEEDNIPPEYDDDVGDPLA